MSLTPPRYTPADFEQASNKWAPAVSDVGAWVEICTPLTCEEIDELHALLRQAAWQARVLDRLREEFERVITLTEQIIATGRPDEFPATRETHDCYVFIHKMLSRLLREEGVTPT